MLASKVKCFSATHPPAYLATRGWTIPPDCRVSKVKRNVDESLQGPPCRNTQTDSFFNQRGTISECPAVIHSFYTSQLVSCTRFVPPYFLRSSAGADGFFLACVCHVSIYNQAELHIRHTDLVQQACHGGGAILRILHNDPEDVLHVLQRVTEPGHLRYLLRPALVVVVAARVVAAEVEEDRSLSFSGMSLKLRLRDRIVSPGAGTGSLYTRSPSAASMSRWDRAPGTPSGKSSAAPDDAPTDDDDDDAAAALLTKLVMEPWFWHTIKKIELTSSIRYSLYDRSMVVLA
uniref:Uncharacterized protein n=1 Tax=Anopheles atroparvus TaxID=41427 RepID=A0A182IQD2_ANOAO